MERGDALALPRWRRAASSSWTRRSSARRVSICCLMVSRSAFCWVTNCSAWSSSTLRLRAATRSASALLALSISASWPRRRRWRLLRPGGLGFARVFFSAVRCSSKPPRRFDFLAARFELVGADRAGARALADEAGALAVEFAFELGLPELQFGLELGVCGESSAVCLSIDVQAFAERGGGLVGGGSSVRSAVRRSGRGWRRPRRSVS